MRLPGGGGGGGGGDPKFQVWEHSPNLTLLLWNYSWTNMIIIIMFFSKAA